MTYEALARKWRPQTFDDIIEQPQVTQTLKNAITAGRIHHGYLFCGPRGTGKTTTARILAKALNCESGPTANPCNSCATCKAITAGSHLDVLEIDAASNTGVDDVRELRESARYVPSSSRYKVYIIDEVHRLTRQAFDALLKTLEEPPPSVVFIFATTEANEVPATVRSRTLRFDFHLISHEALRGAIGRIAAAESIDIDEDAVATLATEAAGSLRDAQSLLDQMSGFTAGPITAELVNEALGIVDTQVLFDMTDAFLEHDADKALNVVTSVARAGRDLRQFTRRLTEHLKRLLFARSLGERFNDESLNQETRTRYVDGAAPWDEGDLLRLVMMSLETANRYKKSALPRLEVEMLALRGTRMDRTVDIRELVDHLHNATQPPTLFSRAGSAERTPSPSGSVPVPGQKTPASPANPSRSSANGATSMPTGTDSTSMPRPTVATTTAATVRAAAPNAGDGRLDFAPIYDSICRSRPTLQAVLGHAELVKTGPGMVDLVVYKGSPFHEQQLRHKPIKDLIHAEIARALGEGLRVRIQVKAGDPSGTAAPSGSHATPPADTAPVNDHNLQEILRRFDGEIVA